jgi:hypothetical protein
MADRGDRVRLAHRQVRWTMPVVAVSVVAAVAAAGMSEWWAALHLALAGATVLLISAVALMLTITWSAAPAPSDLAVAVQRTAVAAGVTAVVAGRRSGAPSWVPVAGAVVYAVGLVLLAVLVVVTVRRGVQRRFDVPAAGYAVACAAGVVGAVFGAILAVGPVSVDLRDAHRVTNLLGLIGIVVSSTLPFFAATVGRARMAPAATPRRLVAVLAWQAVAIALAVVGVASSTSTVGAIGLAADALGLLAVLSLLPRPTRRQLRWSGPRLLGLWIGTGWWVGAVVAAAVETADGRSPLDEPWTAVLVVAAYGQIVWGSLAYLLPVLRGGGHERLGEGFATTRSWIGLVAVNLAGAALVADHPGVARVAVVVWLVDAALRSSVLVVRRPRDASS